ncbi:Sesquiterpene synthase 2 [Cladobotryum mycophilum]|uniref:Terpene synthase n=1 Tax=Cladobotryum mycophilum TaxID=491253 RepID=A0ABR0SUH9_9HYPO
MSVVTATRNTAETVRHVPKRSSYSTILLPDMFQSFLVGDVRVNRHYYTAKLESEAWLNRFCCYSSTFARKIHGCDFSYFCAVSAHSASQARLRTVCDWGNWVFPFDDMFDNGELRDLPNESRRVMDLLMEPMLGNPITPTRPRIVEVHDDIFKRLSKESTPGILNRYTLAMHSYCKGALAHVDDQFSGKMLSLQEIIETRRMSSGVSPLYHLVEYAHNIRLPDEVFEHDVIKELEVLGIDMVSISNDILSYRKERAEGVLHNMVAVCELSGMPMQKAFDTVAERLVTTYRRWDELEAVLPSWNQHIDMEVRRYIDGIKSVVKANLNWSFRSRRYLGPDASKIKYTRRVQITTN